jgi:hypothetical protein
MLREEETNFSQKENIHSSALDCPHEYIDTNGLCIGCGTIQESWYQKGRVYYSKTPLHNLTKVNDRNILKDLAGYNFPEDIKYEANDIFRKIGMPTKRGNERNKMLFFLVYTAFRQKGRFVNPQVLGKEMGLSPGDINRALTAFSEVQTGFRPKIKRATPLDALPELCASLELESITEDVLEMAKEIMEKCPSLNEEFPHKVSAGILSYFMEINGIKIPQELFKKKVDFSDVTIKDIHQRITKIHNQ